MKRVVINKCYGGFGLSTEAMKRLIAEGSKGIEVIDDSQWFSASSEGKTLKEVMQNSTSQYSERYSSVGDGYYIVGFSKDILFKDGKVFMFDRDCRDCPVLIKVVEELGEEADGTFSELKIVEIPDDVEYSIEDYDGWEHVAEKHRTWS